MKETGKIFLRSKTAMEG